MNTDTVFGNKFVDKWVLNNDMLVFLFRLKM
jgi:hypothetical protein